MSKKQISIHKFIRVGKNPKSKRVRGLYSSASFSLALKQALEAYEMDGFIYMWTYSEEKRMSHFLRYELNSKKAVKDFVVAGGRV